MTPLLLEMPEGSTERRAWLETVLMGTRLTELVAQLEELHGEPDQPTTFDELIDEDLLEEVIKRGLSALSDKQISVLLTQPNLLLSLQELIFCSESDCTFWDEVAKANPEYPQLQARMAEQWERLKQEMSETHA